MRVFVIYTIRHISCGLLYKVKYLRMDRFIGQIDTDVTSAWQITTLCLIAQMMNRVFVLIANVNVPCLCKHTHAHFKGHIFKICLLTSYFCSSFVHVCILSKMLISSSIQSH